MRPGGLRGGATAALSARSHRAKNDGKAPVHLGQPGIQGGAGCRVRIMGAGRPVTASGRPVKATGAQAPPKLGARPGTAAPFGADAGTAGGLGQVPSLGDLSATRQRAGNARPVPPTGSRDTIPMPAVRRAQARVSPNPGARQGAPRGGVLSPRSGRGRDGCPVRERLGTIGQDVGPVRNA